MRTLPRAQYAWRPWDVFFAQIEGDGQSLFCLMSISLLFYPLTPLWCVLSVYFYGHRAKPLTGLLVLVPHPESLAAQAAYTTVCVLSV